MKDIELDDKDTDYMMGFDDDVVNLGRGGMSESERDEQLHMYTINSDLERRSQLYQNYQPKVKARNRTNLGWQAPY